MIERITDDEIDAAAAAELDQTGPFWVEEHGRSRTYDEGHRAAIRTQIRALVNQMEQQARRSKATMSDQVADSTDIEAHVSDLRALTLLRCAADWWERS